MQQANSTCLLHILLMQQKNTRNLLHFLQKQQLQVLFQKHKKGMQVYTPHPFHKNIQFKLITQLITLGNVLQ